MHHAYKVGETTGKQYIIIDDTNRRFIMRDQHDGEKLFSKFISVIVKDPEQRKVTLNIDILSMHSTSPGHRRELYIRVTNPEDLVFLHILTLSEDDFLCLKTQQGLLVDYGAFPQKFIDLLELCIKDQNCSSPRFILQLTTGSSSLSHGLLEIIETNPFKHLVHLALKFVPGNDEEVKLHLASCLKQIKDERDSFQRKLSETEIDLSQQLSRVKQSFEEKTKELELLKTQWLDKVSKIHKQHEVELNREKESNIQLRQSYENRLEDQSRNNGDRYNQVVGDLEAKLRDTEGNNKSLTDLKYKYESMIRDLKSQLTTFDEERQIRSRELEKLRLQNHHLDSDRHERDKTLNHLRTRVAVLEQELKDKEHVNKKTNQLLDSTHEQKDRLEADVESKSNQIIQLETSVNSVSSEVIKGNEIIRKLQLEIKSLKSRIKIMTIVTSKQEKLIEEKEASIHQWSKEKAEDRNVISKLKESIVELNKVVEESTKKLNDREETLKNNENVINWLNKQLNEHTLSRLSSTQSTSIRNNSMGSVNRIPFAARNTNTLKSNASQGNHNFNRNPDINNPLVNNNHAGGHNVHNIQQRNVGPYNTVFGKPRFHADNISPIVCQGHNPLRDKQISTPVIHEKVEPVVEPKYLMRHRSENMENETPKSKVVGTDENVDPKSLPSELPKITNSSAKPYLVPSSYFPLK